MSSVSQVGEIFSAAGTAFSKLSELTAMLQVADSMPTHGEKWDEEDMEMLRSAVKKFGDDLCLLTERIKNKTMAANADAIKKKTYEAAGVQIGSQETS